MLQASGTFNAASPFDWVSVLYLYGPVAASVFCLLVMEPRARSQFKNATIPRFVAIPIYCATWAAVLVFLTIGEMYWSKVNSLEAAITGQLQLTAREQSIYSSSAAVFLKKLYGPERHPGYEIRIVTAKKLADGQVIPLYLDFGNKDAEGAAYQLPVRSLYYTEGVTLSYEPGRSNLFASQPGKFAVRSARTGKLIEHLDPQSGAALEREGRPAESFLAKLLRLRAVHAQVKSDTRALLKDLDSADPIVRRNARGGLSKGGQAAVSEIASALTNANANSRTKLGCIVALAGMEGVSLAGLSRAAYAEITDAANSADADLMSAVQTLIARHPEVKGGIEIDPFVGVWRLNREKSALEKPLANLTEENRLIRKIGNKVQTTIRRAFQGGLPPDEIVYEMQCDGKPWKSGNQVLTCVCTKPNVTEGEQSPPRRYYRREVSPDRKTLTISTFLSRSRRDRISLAVYDRL